MKEIADKSFSDVLKESVPNRFLNLTPSQFEEFVCELFKDSGYHAEITKASGDFGADILLEKDGEKIAVQVKRYETKNKVGVQNINQVVGAKAYYSCDRAMVVTTSSFTKSGQKLARKTQTELWDWNKLDSKIKEVYLEGKDVYEYFQEEFRSKEKDVDEYFQKVSQSKEKDVEEFSQKEFRRKEKDIDWDLQEEFQSKVKDFEEYFQKVSQSEEKATSDESLTDEAGFIPYIPSENFTFSIGKVEEEVLMSDKSEATIVHIKMKNATDRKIHVDLKNLFIIDKFGNQFETYTGFVGSFISGDVYPNASVPLIHCWYSGQVPRADVIDSVIVKYGDNSSTEIYKNREAVIKYTPSRVTTSRTTESIGLRGSINTPRGRSVQTSYKPNPIFEEVDRILMGGIIGAIIGLLLSGNLLGLWIGVLLGAVIGYLIGKG